MDSAVWAPDLRSRLSGATADMRRRRGQHQRLRRRIHLQYPTPDLVLLDRLEQGLEVALAKAVVALALDELEEDRADRIGREDLQQHLGLAAVDNALTVDQDAILPQARDVLAMLGQARVDLLEIGLGR